MPETRLPIAIDKLILDIVANPLDRRARHELLSYRDEAMRDAFLTALDNGMAVRTETRDDGSGMTLVLASGTDAKGATWRDLPVMALGDDWDGDMPVSRTMADDVVALWPRLAEARRAQVSV